MAASLAVVFVPPSLFAVNGSFASGERGFVDGVKIFHLVFPFI
jgi:hypothetical protein